MKPAPGQYYCVWSDGTAFIQYVIPTRYDKYQSNALCNLAGQAVASYNWTVPSTHFDENAPIACHYQAKGFTLLVYGPSNNTDVTTACNDAASMDLNYSTNSGS